MQKILRINMKKLTWCVEKSPDTYTLLGGRGLTSKIINAEVPPNCDPLGVENKIVIAPGLLTGTSAPCSGRLSIGSKSPLTGGIKESNVGGTVGQYIARLGIKAIIIEGRSSDKKLYMLEITDDDIRFYPADEITGKANYEVGAYLSEKFGNGTPYITIGPGGEKRLPLATIAVSDLEGKPTRHAGRGGMGAVLGSKGVKAIVFNGKGQAVMPANKELFGKTQKIFAKELVSTKKALTNFGTAILVNVINEAGALPVNNFRNGRSEKAVKISGEVLAENIDSRGGKTGHACHRGCVIRCSNVYRDRQGGYLTSALEYETIVLLGANCGLFDLDDIAELDYLCDNYGLDTMETGAALAVSMEAGLMEFGNSDEMKKMIHEMAAGTVRGRLLGQGAYITGRALGVERIPAVKGQALSAYDPRALKGTGVTYATSPMGADHTCGNCLPGRTGLDDSSPDGQVRASKEVQLLTVLCDNLGLCIFVGPVKENMGKMKDLMNAFTGSNLSGEALMRLADKIIMEETAFNAKAGISKYQNDLPEFFRTEKLHGNLVFDVNRSELQEIYE